MKIFICNAFSLSMLDKEEQASKQARWPKPAQIPVDELIREWEDADPNIEFVSAVGHADTARVFSEALDMDIVQHRQAVRLSPDRQEILLIGQVARKDGTPYRLPEGATTLPDDAIIEWWTV